jgi:predicted  nucleic acid-binding Zn-ribbon protein
VTAAELRTAEAESALEDLRAAQGPQREALAERREALVAERERVAAARQEQAGEVQADLLARYERIRRGKAPFALYPLHADACGHCFTAVPTQRRALILQGTAIDGCEACGVLLYAAP